LLPVEAGVGKTLVAVVVVVALSKHLTTQYHLVHQSQ
jgi:hypothetical protein